MDDKKQFELEKLKLESDKLQLEREKLKQTKKLNEERHQLEKKKLRYRFILTIFGVISLILIIMMILDII